MSAQNIPVTPVNIPVERILLVDEVERTDSIRFEAESTPCHLLHVTLSGEVMQWAGGRPEYFRGGDLIWYHNSEPVQGEIRQAPWRFITIGFSAPRLSPPPDDRRVRRGCPHALVQADRLMTVWRDTAMNKLERNIRCSILLLELLLEVAPLDLLPPPVETYPLNAREQWWQVEKGLRNQLDEPVSLAVLARKAGVSARTLNRACKAATGLSPMQRVRDVRLTAARGLLQYTDLSVTEIALQSGFNRVQDFSRDFKKHFGQTPRDARRNGPDYEYVQVSRSVQRK